MSGGRGEGREEECIIPLLSPFPTPAIHAVSRSTFTHCIVLLLHASNSLSLNENFYRFLYFFYPLNFPRDLLLPVSATSFSPSHALSTAITHVPRSNSLLSHVWYQYTLLPSSAYLHTLLFISCVLSYLE